MITVFFLLVTQILSVFSSININEKSFIIVEWSTVGPFINHTTELVLPNYENVTGRIVLMMPGPFYNSLSYIIFFRKRIEKLAQSGCIGVLTSSRYHLLPGFIKHGSFGDNFPIPVGLVSYSALSYIESLGGVANFTFNNWDTDPWEFLFSGTPYYIIIGIPLILFLFLFVFITYLLMKWIKRLKKIEMNVGFICLTLEWIGSAIKVLQMILSPLHPNFPLPSLEIFLTLSFCINLVTSIVIVFFWLDLTSDPFYRGKFLGIMKIPALILIFLCLGVEISFDILKSINDQIEFIQPLLGFYIIIQAIVVIFNFIAGYRILQTLKKQPEGKKRLHMIIRRIIYSGIVSVIGFIILILALIETTPVSLSMCWLFLQISLFLQSILLITIFQVPKEKKDKSTQDTASAKEMDTEKNGYTRN